MDRQPRRTLCNGNSAPDLIPDAAVRSPAREGTELMSRASDAGPTSPRVGTGVAVTARRVGGSASSVRRAVWPPGVSKWVINVCYILWA